MHQGDVPDYGETEARAPPFPAPGAVNSVKSFEDTLLVPYRDSPAAVLNLQADAAVSPPAPEANRRAGIIVFHRVIDEVGQSLDYQGWVNANREVFGSVYLN